MHRERCVHPNECFSLTCAQKCACNGNNEIKWIQSILNVLHWMYSPNTERMQVQLLKCTEPKIDACQPCACKRVGDHWLCHRFWQSITWLCAHASHGLQLNRQSKPRHSCIGHSLVLLCWSSESPQLGHWLQAVNFINSSSCTGRWRLSCSTYITVEFYV